MKTSICYETMFPQKVKKKHQENPLPSQIYSIYALIILQKHVFLLHRYDALGPIKMYTYHKHIAMDAEVQNKLEFEINFKTQLWLLVKHEPSSIYQRLPLGIHNEIVNIRSLL